MNSRLLIACTVGIGGGFLLPLPSPEAPARKPGVTEPGISRSEKPAMTWPQAQEEIATLPAEECIAALDALLREFGVITPAPEHQDFAVALILRILAGHVDAGAFLKSRRPPSWLLAAAWLENPDNVPVPLRSHLPHLPTGLDAARRIARAMATTDEAKANIFAAAMPATWRRALGEAALLGLATREPIRALRESGISESLHENLAFAAARSGPMEEAVRGINEYVDNDFYGTIKPMLALLHARDSARTADLIAATGDSKLLTWLAEVTASDTIPKSPAKPAVAVLSSPDGVSSGDIERAVKELGFQALQDPAAAKAAWAALPEGKAKDQAAAAIAGALAERDIAAAFAWADKNAPQFTFDVLRVAGDSDAPAALIAVLRLSEGNPQREILLKDLRQHPGRPYLNGFGNISDLPALLRELPPDLQKLIAPEPVIPFEGVKPPPEKREPFDVQLR